MPSSVVVFPDPGPEIIEGWAGQEDVLHRLVSLPTLAEGVMDLFPQDLFLQGTQGKKCAFSQKRKCVFCPVPRFGPQGFFVSRDFLSLGIFRPGDFSQKCVKCGVCPRVKLSPFYGFSIRDALFAYSAVLARKRQLRIADWGY